jgi:hypothetical protein
MLPELLTKWFSLFKESQPFLAFCSFFRRYRRIVERSLFTFKGLIKVPGFSVSNGDGVVTSGAFPISQFASFLRD